MAKYTVHKIRGNAKYFFAGRSKGLFFNNLTMIAAP